MGNTNHTTPITNTIWMPYPSFNLSAQSLHQDHIQELWSRMSMAEVTDLEKAPEWLGYAAALATYNLYLAREARLRQIPDANDWLDSARDWWQQDHTKGKMLVLPPWVGDMRLHRSHRSALRRLPPPYTSYYRRVWPRVPIDLPLVTPATSITNTTGVRQ
jgi:hypothetical protein